MTRDGFGLIDEWGPEKVVMVSDRKTGMRGVLVIDNTARGFGKGGTRMSPTLRVDEVARLARAMTWKWAAVDLFHGGAKAGILGDPNRSDKESILRAFARALQNEVPAEYVFGLDMGLRESDAAIFADELSDRGASTGLPRALGGMPYDQLGVTGFGVAEATDAATGRIDLDIRAARVSVHGFGAVGQAAALRLAELGAIVVAVATAEGTVYDPDGLDVADLVRRWTEFGDAFVRQYPSPLPAEAALTIPTDILIPAARQDTIDVKTAGEVTARLVVEGANLPTSDAARHVLQERGILIVPDFIANAGGIVAAAHSTDAGNSPFVVNTADVFAMITEKLRGNALAVIDKSRAEGIDTHRAAQIIAQERVAEAMELRGQLSRGSAALV